MIEISQGSDFYINIIAPPGSSLPEVVEATYVMYDRSDTLLLQKTLGDGVSFDGTTLVVHLNDIDTSSVLPGKYFHECVVRDINNDDIFLLKNRVTIQKTIARNQ